MTEAERRNGGEMPFSDEEAGRFFLFLAALGLALAVWPALALAVVTLAVGWALGVRWWALLVLALLAAIPLLTGGADVAETYLDSGPAWKSVGAIGDDGLGAFLEDVWRVALPVGLAGAAIGLAVLGRRSGGEVAGTEPGERHDLERARRYATRHFGAE